MSVTLDRTRAVILGLAIVLSAGEVFGDGNASPVFRGAMGVSSKAQALFELPDGKGSWQGEAGTTVPGTDWRIQQVVLSQSQVVLALPGKRNVTLTTGTTLTDNRITTAATVVRPPNKPAGELAAPSPAEIARRQNAARARAQAATQAASPSPEAPSAPAADTPRVETVDVSTQSPSVESFARKGFLTAVMMTSQACPACRAARPWMESLPRRKANSRVIFADVGVTAGGGINFSAPIVSAFKVDHLPYFLLLDEAGAIGAQGEAAEEILKKIMK